MATQKSVVTLQVAIKPVEIQSSKDSNIGGDVTGGNKTQINVEAPALDAIAVHLASTAAQMAAMATTLQRFAELIKTHDTRLEKHISSSAEFSRITMELFEELFASVDGLFDHINVNAKVLELQALLDETKNSPRKRRRKKPKPPEASGS